MFTMRCQNKGGGGNGSLTREPNECNFFGLKKIVQVYRGDHWKNTGLISVQFFGSMFIESGSRLCDVPDTGFK